jgi:GDPmannose 4,6-dehydratase
VAEVELAVADLPEPVPNLAGRIIVRVDPRYFRPTEVETLLGDPGKARAKLGWTPRIRFPDLVAEMVREDLRLARRDALIKAAGYRAFDYREE